MSRASSFYDTLIVTPGILLTLLSFCLFAIGNNSGFDKLGYGISVIVVSLLSQVFVVNMVPICGELLWLDLFNSINAYFCILALFETITTSAIESQEGEFVFRALSQLLSRRDTMPGLTGDSAMQFLRRTDQANTESMAGVLARHALHQHGTARRKQSHICSMCTDGVTTDEDKSCQFEAASRRTRRPSFIKTLVRRNSHTERAVAATADLRSSKTDRNSSTFKPSGAMPEMENSEAESTAGRDSSSSLSDSAFERLAFFERTFFELDGDLSDSIDRGECESFISYAMPHLSVAARAERFSKHDLSPASCLTRLEFVELCVDMMWTEPLPRLRQALDNLKLARRQQRLKNKKKWNQLAKQIDTCCLVVVPTVYATVMLVLFNIDLNDHYFSDPNSPMFSGWAPVIEMGTTGTISCMVPTVVVAVGTAIFVAINRVLATRAQLEKQKVQKALESQNGARSGRRTSCVGGRPMRGSKSPVVSRRSSTGSRASTGNRVSSGSLHTGDGLASCPKFLRRISSGARLS